jgi:amino acid transporter
MNSMKLAFRKIGAVLTGVMATSLPLIARADTPSFLPADAGEIDLGTNDPVDTVVNIINWGLGILGLIAVVFIIIGGFRWMTAGGNEQSVESAKKILIAAIIGLVIVMASYGVSLYVFTVLINVTGA